MDLKISGTNSKINFWETVASHLKNGERVFLALVVDHTVHSPGTTGAKLLVTENNKMMGTIGGGIMEYNLVNRAKEILENGEFTPELQTLIHQKSGYDESSGMICAGKQTNLYCVFNPEKDDKTIFEIVNVLKNGQSAVLSISQDGLAIQKQNNEKSNVQFKLTKNDKNWVYQEQLKNFKNIAIIGGGHCSFALSRIMNQLDYDVFVFDTRSNLFTVDENKFAQSIQIVNDYLEVADKIDYPEITQVVVMTTNVTSDVRGLLGILQFPFPFIGVMGSQAKISEIKKRLKRGGISNGQLNKLTAPVGIPMTSNTPEEIAISVAAQLLQLRAGLFN
jgi:xanthine dehydrogenase accessory factor